MSFLDDMGALLESSGVLPPGVQVSLSQLPNTPDDCVGLLEYAGAPPRYAKREDHPTLRRTRFQAVCRSKGYRAARERAEAVLGALGGVSGHAAASGERYASVRALGEPMPLNRDDSGRWIVSCNYEALRA